MFRFAASYSRRALLAAAVAIVSMVSMPAFAAPVEPLVTPQWLNENRSKDDVVVLDIRSAIDGGGSRPISRRTSPAPCTATTTRPAGA